MRNLAVLLVTCVLVFCCLDMGESQHMHMDPMTSMFLLSMTSGNDNLRNSMMMPLIMRSMGSAGSMGPLGTPGGMSDQGAGAGMGNMPFLFPFAAGALW